MCGAGCAFDVVQLAINFSPMKNCCFLNVILGGPVCGTVKRNKKKRMENKITNIGSFVEC